MRKSAELWKGTQATARIIQRQSMSPSQERGSSKLPEVSGERFLPASGTQNARNPEVLGKH